MSSFRWRDDPAHDDADAADDRLISSSTNGAPRGASPQQPLGELLPAMRNAVSQADQRADAQRRRAARAETRLRQLQGDLAWIALGVAIVAFGLGFAVAWAIVRRGGGL